MNKLVKVTVEPAEDGHISKIVYEYYKELKDQYPDMSMQEIREYEELYQE